jgi:hypothetical protein
MKRLNLLVVALGMFFSASLAWAQDINFEDLQRPGPGLSQTLTVSGLGKEGQELIQRFSEIDSGRVEASRQARSSSSGSSASSAESSESSSSSGTSSSGWRLVKQYEGGFSEFGFDTAQTIFLIKCGDGREHKIYRDKRGKWGAVGGAWNNSGSSLEDAASKECS